MSIIDWSNPRAKISQHFTVGHATFLPDWHVHHLPDETQQAEILKTAATMEKIYTLLEQLEPDPTIFITSWIRPPKVYTARLIDRNAINWSTNAERRKIQEAAFQAGDYNRFIGGATLSYHRLGMAVDFVVKNVSCDDIRTSLIEYGLETLDIRIEDMPKTNWVHIDRGNPAAHGGNRAFKV
jgi:hypothetical protein